MPLLVGLQQEFLWGSLAEVERLLPKSFLSYWAGPVLVLWLERIGFPWGHCFSMPVGISRLLASPVSSHVVYQSAVYRLKRKPRELATVSFLGSKFSSHFSG